MIEKLVYGGDGLARIDSDGGKKKTVFVPLVLPGERVEASVVEERPGFARARLDRVLEPAAMRAAAPCPYFGECGGCHLQHATYEAQLQSKATVLRETVARIAKIELPEIATHASPPLNYRNRTRMKIAAVHGQPTNFAIGYYRMASHSLLPVRECPISSPLINRAIKAMWSLAETHELPQGLAEIEFFVDEEDRVLLLEFMTDPSSDESQLRKFAQAVKAALPEIVGIAAIPRVRSTSNDTVAAPELENQSADQPVMLVGKSSLKYTVGEFSYQVSAGAFFQTNRFVTQKLVELVTHGISGRHALDLYAGAGLFTLPLAKHFERVTAVEASPVSFADLSANIPATAKAVEATSETYLQNFRGSKPDYVVVDPTRSGLGKKVVAALVKLAPQHIAYVSCDPSTLSRDLPGLLAAGYRVTQAHLIDLFPQTFHIESVLHLER